MEEEFNVISIKHTDFEGYVNEEFFNGIVNEGSHINVKTCLNPYNAMRFLYEANERKVKSLIAFIESCYPKKQYSVELVKVNVSIKTSVVKYDTGRT